MNPLLLSLRIAVALAALAAVVVVDALHHDRAPWVMFLYVMPLALSVLLPPLAVVGMVLLALLSGVVLASTSGDAWSIERILSLGQILLLGLMAYAVRLARDELARSNERVSGILEGSNTGFVRATPDLRVIDVNDPWLRMVGARRERDVRGTRLTDWLPEDRRRTAEAMLAFLGEGDRRSFETVLRPHAGAGEGPRIHVVITAYAERVGEQLQIAAVFADVSAIRRAEAQARASEQQLRSHLEHTPLAAVVLDGEQQIREWNRAAEQIFGYGRQTALGMSAWELVPAETRAERATPFGEGASTRGDESGHRARQCTREGEQITLQWYHTPLRSSAGEVVQVASLGLDVTRQEQMEQALRVSETKFSSVFQHSPDALLLIRMRDRHLIDANRAVERLLGVPAAEFRTHLSAYGDFFLDAEDLVRFRARLAAGDGVEAFETELRRDDGEPLAVLLSARPLQIGGEATLLVTIRDLTPIREGEAERNRLQQQLQQAQHLEGIGRLAGGVAHDFNNMLAGIQGYAELIDAQSREPGQVSLYADRILEATQRAADLVGKLLTFSRQGSIEKRYFGLDAVVRDTLDLFAQSLDPQIRLVPRLTGENVAVHGDESQISNALLNLCINARDALDQGGTIEVLLERRELDAAAAGSLDPELGSGDYVVLTVRDDGCGIPREQLEEIFVPFYTTKPKGRGTGLGLPSVYGAVKAHGGTVRVDSRVGAGSSFSLWLPAWPLSQVNRPVAAGEVRTPELGSQRVLVVDDEPAIRETLTRTLEALGCRVTAVADGRGALAAFRADPGCGSLVILDLILPDLSGEEVFRGLREMAAGVRVIFMSGYDHTAALQRVLGEGAAGVLKKPFSRGDLLREIERIGRLGPPEPPTRLRVVR